MYVYLCYFTDEKGQRLSTSFGWTESPELAELYIKSHRLMNDSDCEHHIDKIRIKKNDFDNLHFHMKDMNFYPYTPDVNTDTQIQVTVVDDGNWWSDGKPISVVTTNDTLYYAVGRRVTSDPYIYNPKFDEGLGYDRMLDTSIDVCKELHWMVTGEVINQNWFADLLEKAIIRVSKCELTSYQEFNSVLYCVMTGYLNPI